MRQHRRNATPVASLEGKCVYYGSTLRAARANRGAAQGTANVEPVADRVTSPDISKHRRQASQGRIGTASAGDITGLWLPPLRFLDFEVRAIGELAATGRQRRCEI